MKNDYNNIQNLNKTSDNFNKIKQILKSKLSYLLISEEEKEKLVKKILEKAIDEYNETTTLPFLHFASIKLKKEIDAIYFKPTSTIPIMDQKIINLYLSKENDNFLSETEIQKRLQIYSSDIYRIVNILKNRDSKVKKELQSIFPNYKQQLKERNLFFKTQKAISDTDILYLAYYIGEINDICLDIKEIAIKEGKSELEIEKSLNATFQSLKQPNILKLIKGKYPKCEKILQIKALNFGVKLQTEENLKQTTKPLLTPKQERLLKELASNPNISKKELAKRLDYKDINSVYVIFNNLKKKCKTNEKLKEKVLELYPDFLSLKPKKEQAPKKEKALLTPRQERLLKELANNPNVSRKELRDQLDYKNINSIWTVVNRLKKKCKTNEKLKEKILELYPDFFKPKPKKEKAPKKERPLLTPKQERLLKELANNPNISRKELRDQLDYKSINSVWSAIDRLKKKCKTNEKLKEKVLELYPDFFKPKPKKEQAPKKERPLLTPKQERLLKELANNPNISKKDLTNLLDYKSINSVYVIFNNLKKKCKTNEKLKEKVLELYPDFFKPKPKKEQEQKKEKALLTPKQETLLKELANNPNISRKELAKRLDYKDINSIWTVADRLKKKCKTNEKLKEKVLELYPDFLSPKPKKEKDSLIPRQERLLKELANNPNISKKELTELLGYKNINNIYVILNNLKKKCKTNEKLKEKVLELYPDFFKPKPKKDSVLTNRELEILQNIYLIIPPNTSYATYTQLAEKLHYSEQNILTIKKQALEKIETNQEIKEQLQKNWPTFNQDKVIKEQYKKGRSIKIPSEEVEGIKTFIRQFDIPENEIKVQENPILTGIKNLEESIFSSYVSKCTEEQKAMLALRLGYINAPATTETVAKLFNVEKQEVITLTKNCLKSVKYTTDTKEIAKVYEKKNGCVKKSV